MVHTSDRLAERSVSEWRGSADQGAFERFPRLNLVVLESTGRLDPPDGTKFEVNGFTTLMKMKPSKTFRRNCGISTGPAECSAKFSAERLGSDWFMWVYDYRHSDAVTEPVNKLAESLGGLSVEHRDHVLAENAKALYGI